MAEHFQNSRGRLRFRRLLCCFPSRDTSPVYPLPTRSASEPPSPTRANVLNLSPSMGQDPRGEATLESPAVLATEEHTGLATGNFHSRDTGPTYPPSTKSASDPCDLPYAGAPDLSSGKASEPPAVPAPAPDELTDLATPQSTTLATQPPGSPVGTTIWTAFKEALKAIERASDAFPPLKSTVAGLNVVLDRIKIVHDTSADLTGARDRIAQFVEILRKYEDSTVAIPSAIRDCMDAFARVVDVQRSSIENKLERGIIKRIIEASDDQAEIVGFARTIGYLVDQLVVAISLTTERNVRELLKDEKFKKLGHVAEASFKGPHSFGKGCMEGTRECILLDLMTWACDPDAPNLYWLTGLAGTGKSAIAYSFCRLLDEINLLGGSFFCSRQATLEQRNVCCVLPTLAHNMAQASSHYAEALLQSLDKTPDAAKLSVDEQFGNLILSISGADSKIHVLVIDALDECEDNDMTAALVDLCIKHAKKIKIKIFMTSRPEKDLRLKFDQFDPKHILYLHHIEDSFIKHDIQIYLQNELNNIFKNHYRSDDPKPSSNQIETLCAQADKLFIYAFTSLQYIKARNADPENRLNILTDANTHGLHSIKNQLDSLYHFILSAAFKDLNEDETSDYQQFLMCVLSQLKPMSVEMISKFLDKKISYLGSIMNGFHSVLDIPSDTSQGHVTTFHASFEDYITKEGSQNQFSWHMDISTGHDYMAQKCFQIMNNHLCFNIYKCETSYLPNDKQNLATISQELYYACLYWPEHFLRSSYSKHLLDQFKNWIQSQFLYWLEVISVTCMVTQSTVMLRRLHQNFKKDHVTTKMTLLNDILHFLNTCKEPISKSVAHIYISALAFGAVDFSSFKIYKKLFARLLSLYSNYKSNPYNNVLILTGHTWFITSVAFSPDGRYIVSGSLDKTIRLWSSETGEAIGDSMEGHTDYIESVAFSPDGKYIVSGSHDETIRLWSSETGEAVRDPMEGHTHCVNSVAFSPDGKYIVSGSYDKTIRLWSSETGEAMRRPIEGHTHDVKSVAFSLDGRYIMCGSNNTTIRAQSPEICNYAKQLEEENMIHISSSTFDAHQRPIYNKKISKCLGLVEIEKAIKNKAATEDKDNLWIFGPDKELLLWVPHHYLQHLHWPHNAFIIAHKICTLDLSRFEHGDTWTYCRSSDLS